MNNQEKWSEKPSCGDSTDYSKDMKFRFQRIDSYCGRIVTINLPNCNLYKPKFVWTMPDRVKALLEEGKTIHVHEEIVDTSDNNKVTNFDTFYYRSMGRVELINGYAKKDPDAEEIALILDTKGRNDSLESHLKELDKSMSVIDRTNSGLRYMLLDPQSPLQIEKWSASGMGIVGFKNQYELLACQYDLEVRSHKPRNFLDVDCRKIDLDWAYYRAVDADQTDPCHRTGRVICIALNDWYMSTLREHIVSLGPNPDCPMTPERGRITRAFLSEVADIFKSYYGGRH